MAFSIHGIFPMNDILFLFGIVDKFKPNFYIF